MSTKHTIIKFRRGTAAEWSASEPQPGGEVLKLGEPGWEKDTGKLKIGDGVTGWNNLLYLQAENDEDVILTEENVDDAVGNLLVGGSGIGVNYNDDLDTLTISVSGLTSSLITDFNESVQDNLNTSLVAGSGIALTYDSGAETLTISSSGITLEEVQDNFGNSFLVAGNGVGLSYSDAGNSLTISVEDAPRIVTTVFNETGFQIAKMQAVYIGGGHGDLPTVELAIATGDVTSAGTYGLTYQAIDNMDTGEVIVFGALTGVNTDPAHGGIAGATEGSTLYLSPTTPGGLTTTKPSAPNHMVVIGTVVRVHQNEGVIEVRIQNGYELDELHNVAISGATNGQFLQYNSSSQLWVPSSSGNFSTLQVSGTNVSISGHTHISSNITDFTEAVQDVVGASGFLVGASGISISYNDGSNSLTITGGGGGGATITNAGDNRILTSDGTSTGINGESNLTFDGSLLLVDGTIRLGDTAGNRLQLFKGGGAIYDYSLAKEGNHLAISTANDGSSFRYTQFGYHSGSTWTPKTVINNYNGKIGIVNTTPSYELDVTGSGHFTQNLLVDGDCSIGATKAYKWDGNAWGYDRIIFRSDVNNKITSDGSGNYNWLVAGRNWTLSDVGNVGIKTGSPSRTLHVVGSGYFDGYLDVDNLRLDANTISSTNSNGNIVLAPNGTGDVQVDADTLRVGDSNAAATITSNGTGNLTISTNSGTNSGSIVINQGVNGNIGITPNGTGEVDLSKVDIDGGSIDNTIIGATSAASGKFTQLYPTVVSNGTVSGSVSTNVANGQIFDMTVSGATTLSNPTNAVDGVTVRWRITQDGTGGHSVSLDTEFQIPSSASSPLPWSTAANATDILAATYHAGRGKWDVVAFVPGY